MNVKMEKILEKPKRFLKKGESQTEVRDSLYFVSAQIKNCS